MNEVGDIQLKRGQERECKEVIVANPCQSNEDANKSYTSSFVNIKVTSFCNMCLKKLPTNILVKSRIIHARIDKK